MKRKKLISVASSTICVAVSMLWGASLANAAIIADLRNTGLDNLGNYIATHGTPDGNYTMLSAPAAYPAVTVDDTGFPIAFGPWVANNPGSRWIGPDISSNGLGGNYVYRTTFTLPANAELTTVLVKGCWATDDPGIDIEINGISTGQLSGGMAVLVPFAINSGFVIGTNTLDFHVVNAPIGTNPTGLRVDCMVGTYQIPEPTSACITCAGLLFAVLVPRCMRSERHSK